MIEQGVARSLAARYEPKAPSPLVPLTRLRFAIASAGALLVTGLLYAQDMGERLLTLATSVRAHVSPFPLPVPLGLLAAMSLVAVVCVVGYAPELVPAARRLRVAVAKLAILDAMRENPDEVSFRVVAALASTDLPCRNDVAGLAKLLEAAPFAAACSSSALFDGVDSELFERNEAMVVARTRAAYCDAQGSLNVTSGLVIVAAAVAASACWVIVQTEAQWVLQSLDGALR
jgi:hypothetical protein